MKEESQNLSSLIDNEFDDQSYLDEVLDDASLQDKFSRYQYIGDVIRGESNDFGVHLDVTDSVMASIKNETQDNNVVELTQPSKSSNNIVPFMKNFGQYAIAASVAGVVVVSSLLVNDKSVTEPGAAPVLNTVPFAGTATPVSLQTTTSEEVQNEIKKRNERLEALLKDHQLQLQSQP